MRDWAGTELPAPLQARLARAGERLAVVAAQRAALDTTQQERVRTAPAGSALARLVQLKGVATTSAAVLLDEGLLWREFRNRREIGGFLGFAPTPYASGDAAHEQGVSRAGNNRLQVISVQLAWSWVHWQPESALSQWYRTDLRWKTRAANRDRRAGPQVSDRVVAVCHHRGGTDRRDSEGCVALALHVARAWCVRFVAGRPSADRNGKVPPPTCPTRDCIVSGAAPSARARIKAEA